MSQELREKIATKWSKKFSKEKETTFDKAMMGALTEYGNEIEQQTGVADKIKSLQDDLFYAKQTANYWKDRAIDPSFDATVFMTKQAEYYNKQPAKPEEKDEETTDHHLPIFSKEEHNQAVEKVFPVVIEDVPEQNEEDAQPEFTVQITQMNLSYNPPNPESPIEQVIQNSEPFPHAAGELDSVLTEKESELESAKNDGDKDQNDSTASDDEPELVKIMEISKSNRELFDFCFQFASSLDGNGIQSYGLYKSACLQYGINYVDPSTVTHPECVKKFSVANNNDPNIVVCTTNATKLNPIHLTFILISEFLRIQSDAWVLVLDLETINPQNIYRHAINIIFGVRGLEITRIDVEAMVWDIFSVGIGEHSSEVSIDGIVDYLKQIGTLDTSFTLYTNEEGDSSNK